MKFQLPSVIDLVTGVVKPLTDLVDNVHTSEEERLTARGVVLGVQASVLQMVLNYETAALQAQAGVIMAEANSESWIARNWRPITMLVFLGLVVSYWMGWAGQDLPKEHIDQLFLLIQIGLGGYIAGRSGEKIAKAIGVNMAIGSEKDK